MISEESSKRVQQLIKDIDRNMNSGLNWYNKVNDNHKDDDMWCFKCFKWCKHYIDDILETVPGSKFDKISQEDLDYLKNLKIEVDEWLDDVDNYVTLV